MQTHLGYMIAAQLNTLLVFEIPEAPKWCRRAQPQRLLDDGRQQRQAAKV
jgi:hypothetical protein